MRQTRTRIIIIGSALLVAAAGASGYGLNRQMAQRGARVGLGAAEKTPITRTIYINGARLGSFDWTRAQGVDYASVPMVMQALKHLGLTYAWLGAQLELHTGLYTSYRLPTTADKNKNTQLLVNGTPAGRINILHQFVNARVARYISIPDLMHILEAMNLGAQWQNDGLYIREAEYKQDDPLRTGVAPGILTHGSAIEHWHLDIKANFTLSPLTYDPGDNEIPVAGTYSGSGNLDALLSVWYSAQGKWGPSWNYIIPVKNHHFSSTIVLPFRGDIDVMIQPHITTIDVKQGDQQIAHSGMYDMMVHSTNALSQLQMGQIESDVADYTTNPAVGRMAKAIAAAAVKNSHGTSVVQERYDVIKAVSHWVSANICYEWSRDKAGNHQVPHSPTWILSHWMGINKDQTALTIAFLRSLGIPSFVVMGNASRGGKSYSNHEWVEAWDGNRWVPFDPSWDQVYTQTTWTMVPDGVDETYFDSISFVLSHHAVKVMNY